MDVQLGALLDRNQDADGPMKQLIAFDLDGTLANSKQAIDPDMSDLLGRLLEVAMVAVISGGDWPQFERQFVSNLPKDIDFARLFLLPTSGTKLYRYDNGWQRSSAELFSEAERDHILRTLEDTVTAAGLSAERSWGEKIEDRGSQITFSGLGQQAPLIAKHSWDPDFVKRKRLQAALAPLLPGFAVNVGGSTSIDITREGVDKAYGMRKLAEVAGVPVVDMIFVGDALYPGGNDYPVRAAGVDTIAVRDITETKRVIETIVFCLGQGPERSASAAHPKNG
jgi:phosphomannomutase